MPKPYAKHKVGPKLANPPASNGGNESLFNGDLGPIWTAKEYCSAATKLVDAVEDVSADNEKMLNLSSALERLLLARYDPPLPLWWTFIGVEKFLWLDRKSEDPLMFGRAILDFARGVLLSLKSLSFVNASGRTALAAIAPVVDLVCDVVTLLSNTAGPLDESQTSSTMLDGNRKKVRKLTKNLKEFIRELLGFGLICQVKDSRTSERAFSLPSAPNVPLETFPDCLYPALTLASKRMTKPLSKDLFNSALLAEIVSFEVVLLQLIAEIIDRRIALKKRAIDFNVGLDEFVQSLKYLAVHAIWDPTSPSPPEIFLDALTEKRLPVLNLLDAKEESLLRGVLLQILLIDPPPFSRSTESGEPSAASKSGLDHYSIVFLKKISVARRAVAFYRSREERSRLATLEMQMATWAVPPQLLKWFKSKKKELLPVVALQNQRALATWLVKTAEKCVWTALWSSALASVGTAQQIEVLEVDNGETHPDRDGEDLFFVDTTGDAKSDVDTAAVDLGFEAAAKAMKGDSEKTTKKKKTKPSKVLFQRHEQSSNGTKRSRMETDGVDSSSSSDSDSEDTKGPGTKSAKKVKKSSRKVIDWDATSEEDEDDNKYGALALTYLAPVDGISPENLGNVGTQLQEEAHFPRTIETPKHHGVNKDQDFGQVMSHGAATQEVSNAPQQVVSGTLLENEEVGPLGTPHVSSQGTSSLRTSSGSRRGKTKQQLQVAGGAAETEELPSQPELTVNTPLAVTEVHIHSTSTVSGEEPGLVSVGKSARRKKKKKPTDPEHLGIEAGGAEAEEFPSQLEDAVNIPASVADVDIQSCTTIPQLELVLLSGGKSSKNKKLKESDDRNISRAWTEALSSQHLLETVNPSEPAIGVVTQSSLTIGAVEPVPLSAGKSSKKKKKFKDPEDACVGAGVGGTEQVPSLPCNEMDNTSISLIKLDIQGTPTSTQLEPVLTSVGVSAKKRMSKGPKGTAIDACGARTARLPSQLWKETVNTSGSVQAGDVQNSSITSGVERVLVSVEKSAKKKKSSKDPVDPNVEATAHDVGTKGKGAALKDLVESTKIDFVEARTEVQGEDGNDLAEEVTTIAGEEAITLKSSLHSSLTLQNQVCEDREETGDGLARVQGTTPRNVEEEVLLIKSSKKKRKKETSRLGIEDDQNQIFDTIKQELVTVSAKLSSGDVLDALQVEKSLQGDQQEKNRNTTTRNKRARLGDHGNSIGGVQGTVASPPAASIFVGNVTAVKIETELTRDGKISQGDGVSAEEEVTLPEILADEIIGSRAAEDDVSEPNASKPGFTLAHRPIDNEVLGAGDGAEVTDRPVLQPTNVIEQIELRTPGVPASGTSPGSELKKRRDLSSTPTSRKKRAKDRMDIAPPAVGGEVILPKIEVIDITNVSPSEGVLQGWKNQGEREKRTPDSVHIEAEPVSSVKPSSRKGKVKPSTSGNVDSDLSEGIVYQRRTRSGRALGTPITPSRKVNTRKKLGLGPLEE